MLSIFDSMLDVYRLDLRKMLAKYYDCTDHHEKQSLRAKIIDNVKQQLREQSINVDFGDIDLSGNNQFMLWHTWFYDVFSQGGFDIVIGNPPYVLIQTLNDDGLERIYKKLYTVASYKIDLYHLFIEKGYNVLKESGILSFINPTTFLTNNYTQPLRDLLLNKSCVLGLINISDNVFEASVNTGIEILQKKDPTDFVLQYFNAEFVGYRFVVKLISSVRQLDYLNSEKHIIQPISSNEAYQVVQKIERHSNVLKKHATVNFGMQLRNRKLYTNDVVVTNDPNSLTIYHKAKIGRASCRERV